MTVLSGTLHVGMGVVVDRGHGVGCRQLCRGPEHDAFTGDEPAVFQLSIGAWGITYVDPADDFRQ